MAVLMLAAYEDDAHDLAYRKLILREFDTFLTPIGCEHAKVPSSVLYKPGALRSPIGHCLEPQPKSWRRNYPIISRSGWKECLT